MDLMWEWALLCSEGLSGLLPVQERRGAWFHVEVGGLESCGGWGGICAVALRGLQMQPQLCY